METAVPIVVVIGCSLVASITDVAKFKVFNLLTVPCFVAGVIFGVAMHGWPGLWFSLGGAFLGFGILLIPYLMGGLGAGDVKFVMAIGAWVGPGFLIPAIIIGCIATVVYFLVVIAQKNHWRGLWTNLHLMFMRLTTFGKYFASEDQMESIQVTRSGERSKGRLIPFSAMVSIGIIVVLLIGFIVT